MNTIIIILAVLLGIILIIYFVLISLAPKLPPETEATIEETLKNEGQLPKFIKGKEGTTRSSGVEIYYNVMCEVKNPKATILLVMGHSTTLLAWPSYLYQPMLDAGYQVIRYDNRGVGMSDWCKDWDKKNPHSLEDMAKDGIAVLDTVGVEKAHVFGVSMGGMLAQTMAIQYPERLSTLTSVMSSGFTFDPELKAVKKSWYWSFVGMILKYNVVRNDKNALRFGVSVVQILKGKGDYQIDVKGATERTLYEMRKRKGFNLKAGDQHTAAIKASGSRYDALKKLTLPVLVIHGTTDPLVLPEHSRKYAPMIPNAEQLWIEGMGHDLPKTYVGQMLDAAFQHFEKV